MNKYIRKHENYIKEMLTKTLDYETVKKLGEYHNRQIQWMQHERIVHLIVTLFICLFMLLSFGFTIIKTSMPTIALSVLLLILSIAYIIHYYRLENSVQRWYLLSDRIEKHLGL